MTMTFCALTPLALGTGGTLGPDAFTALQTQALQNSLPGAAPIVNTQDKTTLDAILAAANRSNPGTNPTPATGDTLPGLIQRFTETASHVASGSAVKGSLTEARDLLSHVQAAATSTPTSTNASLEALSISGHRLRNAGAGRNSADATLALSAPTVAEIVQAIVNVIIGVNAIRGGARTFHENEISATPTLLEIVNAIHN